ncbi:MAG: hypothetical protein AB3N23_06225 [Paracoccaceae bacterium]
MVSGMRLAEEFGCQLQVAWPVGHLSQSLQSPEHLFGEAFVREHFVEPRHAFQALTSTSKRVADFETRSALQQHFDAGGTVRLKGLSKRFSLPEESEAAAEQAFIQTARRLPLHSAISDRLARFETEMANQTITAVHVRRGDIIGPTKWSQMYWPTKYVPDEFYDAALSDRRDETFLLFTDTPETLWRFQKLHDVRAARELLDLDGLDEAQADLCELLAISRCASVICADNSAFSSAAAKFGGTQKVTLPDDLQPDTRRDAEHNLIRRVSAGPRAFVSYMDYAQSAHWAYDIQMRDGQHKDAHALATHVAHGRIWVGHMADEAMRFAIRNDNHDDLLDLMHTRHKRATKAGRAPLPHARPSAESMTYLLTSYAWQRLNAPTLASRALSDAILLQSEPNMADHLAAHLEPHLIGGSNEVLPTTVLPYGQSQVPPKATEFPGIQTAITRQKLGSMPPVNWQCAIMLDWHDLCIDAGFAPSAQACEVIAQIGAQGSPTQKSLAALAQVRLQCPDLAAVLVDEALAEAERQSGLEAALIFKRAAQVRLMAGKQRRARQLMARALERSDHPAFQCWWAAQDARRGAYQAAWNRLNALPTKPAYALRWLIRATAQLHSTEDPQIAQLQTQLATTMRAVFPTEQVATQRVQSSNP